MLSTCFWWCTIGAYVYYARQPNVRRYTLVAFVLRTRVDDQTDARDRAGRATAARCVAARARVTWPWSSSRSEETRQTWIVLIREKIPLIALAVVSTVITFIAQRQGGAVIPVGHLAAQPSTGERDALVHAVSRQNRVARASERVLHISAHDSAAATCRGGAVSSSACRRGLPALAPVSVRAGRVGVVHCDLAARDRIVQVGSQALADRYTYVPLVGIFVAAIWGFQPQAEAWGLRPPVLAVPAVVVVVALAATARTQVTYWRNSEALWAHAVEVMPDNYVAYGALASLRQAAGRQDEAFELFKKAVATNPSYPDARVDLGNQFLSRGEVDEAVKTVPRRPRLDAGLCQRPPEPWPGSGKPGSLCRRDQGISRGASTQSRANGYSCPAGARLVLPTASRRCHRRVRGGASRRSAKTRTRIFALAARTRRWAVQMMR